MSDLEQVSRSYICGTEIFSALRDSLLGKDGSADMKH